MVKYIFVTGGVASGLGKGITSASLGRLLKERGFRVMLQKFDPYINEDPGNMSPYQHGEVFVTDDGSSTDLDIGHYERFIDENLNKNSDVTTGNIYSAILNKERKGDYHGGTVQVIPHITNAIKDRIYGTAKSGHADILITEVGGTVGDIEGLPYLEAIRQVSSEVGRENVLYIHLTLVPYLRKSGELKTKPTQHSVKELRSIGISPDIIVCRTELPLSKDIKEKISLFCNLDADCVIQNLDVEVLYEVPLMLEEEGIADITCRRLNLECEKPDLKEWTAMVEKQKNLKNKIEIALVGKYTELHDAYLSYCEALRHGGITNDAEVEIRWVNAEDIEKNSAEDYLKDADGIVAPGGFGIRGVEGIISAITYARENKIPFLGTGLGMEMAVVEFSRNVLGFKDAHSTEFDPDTAYPVVDVEPQKKDADISGFEIEMRRGVHPCKNAPGSRIREIYGEDLVYERHRNKYEVNSAFISDLEQAGMKIAGISPSEKLVEVVELQDHPWFIGVMFHAEFKSRPNRPHPLFISYVEAVLKNKKSKN